MLASAGFEIGQLSLSAEVFLFFAVMAASTFILIPCYNESQVICQTLASLLPLGYQIVIIDDGSQTELWPMLRQFPIHYLRHPVNLGQGAALQTGMDYAKMQGAEIVVHFDADGQHSPADIPRFLQALQNGADVALGSRFLRPEDRKQVPLMRRIILQGARCVNGIFAGMWLTDAHNGFRALNKKALAAINLTENRMAHATEIISQIKTAKLTMQEVPTSINYSEYARAKGQKWYQTINILLDLILNKLF